MESQQKSFFELFAKRAFFKLGESQQATEGKALFLIDKERFHSIKNFRKIYQNLYPFLAGDTGLAMQSPTLVFGVCGLLQKALKTIHAIYSLSWVLSVAYFF